MAFNFGSILGNIGTIADIAQTGLGLYEAFRDDPAEEAALRTIQQGQQQVGAGAGTLAEALGMARASVDPRSAQFQNLSALLAEANRRDLVAGLDELMKRRRRDIARGRTPGIVESERAEEARTRMLAQGYAQAQERARLMAADMLSRGAGQLTGIGGAQSGLGAQYAALTQVPLQVGAAERERRTSGYGSIGDLGHILEGIFASRSEGTQETTPIRTATAPPVSLLPADWNTDRRFEPADFNTRY